MSPNDTTGHPFASEMETPEEYDRRAAEATERAEYTTDLVMKRQWLWLAAQWRELAAQRRRSRGW